MGIQFDGINNEIKSQTKIDFPGSVGVAGTLTYEDVANVDSIGIITARTGINIGPTAGVAGTFFADGSYVTAGIITAGSFIGDGSALTGIDLGAVTGATGDFSIADKIVHTGDTHTAIRFAGNDIITTEIAGSETLRIDGTGLRIVDKLLHSGDPDTMIRFPAADTFTVETAGSERFRIDSTGRISSGKHGVGTYNDASEWFKVQSNDSAANISIVGSNDTHSSLNLGDEDDFNIQKIKSDHTNNSLQFFTADAERLRITSDGNIGINETSPQQQLHVHDDTTYHGIFVNGSAAPRITFARSTTTTGEWSVGIDGTNGNNFAINNSGDNSNNKIVISSSQVSLYGAVSVPNGDVVMGSGRGIDFSATANAALFAPASPTQSGQGYDPSTDSEVLTHYEHGTWTPRLRAYDHTGGAGWGHMVYSDGTVVEGTGRYVRIGRYVWAGFNIESGSKQFDTGWTYWSIDTIPFGANHYDGRSGGVQVFQTNAFTDTTNIIGGRVNGADAYLVGTRPSGEYNATINTSSTGRYIRGHAIFYTSTG